jgi:hypothetical protein
MQSKLSIRQKKFLIHSFHKNCVTGFGKRPDCTKSEYNSNRRSIHLLIKRGLVLQYNKGKYLKEFLLSGKGYDVALELLLGYNPGFAIESGRFKEILDLITKRKYYEYLHVVIDNDKVTMEVLDEKKGKRLRIDVVNVYGIQYFDYLVVKIQHLKEDLKKYLRKAPWEQLYVISIKTQDSLIWLNIKTLDNSWDFHGVDSMVFGAPFQVGGLKAIRDVWPIEPDKATI